MFIHSLYRARQFNSMLRRCVIPYIELPTRTDRLERFSHKLRLLSQKHANYVQQYCWSSNFEDYKLEELETKITELLSTYKIEPIFSRHWTDETVKIKLPNNKIESIPI